MASSNSNSFFLASAIAFSLSSSFLLDIFFAFSAGFNVCSIAFPSAIFWIKNESSLAQAFLCSID
jgi:hypothetical protein